MVFNLQNPVTPSSLSSVQIQTFDTGLPSVTSSNMLAS